MFPVVIKEKHIVLVGAGLAHLATITALRGITGDGARVTVISPGSYQYYPGMGAGLLSGHYAPGDVRVNIRELCRRRGAEFVEARVTGIDPDARKLRLDTRDVIPYDLVSFDIGSVVDTQATGIPASTSVVPVKPVERLFDTRCFLLNLLHRGDAHVLIVGGGATGVELAAHAAAIPRIAKKRGADIRGEIHVTLVTRRTILDGFPDRIRGIALKKLRSIGVQIYEQTTVRAAHDSFAELQTGERVQYDRILLATGIKPPDLFERSRLPIGRSGGLLVGECLSSPAFPDVFGGGDCIDFEPRNLAKILRHSIRQNRVLHHNIATFYGARKPKPFRPKRNRGFALSFGDGTGLRYPSILSLSGRIPFLLKQHRDRRYIRRFQECDESSERIRCPGE